MHLGYKAPVYLGYKPETLHFFDAGTGLAVS